MFCFGDVCMYWFIGVGVKNLLTSWYRPLESTPLSSPAWRAATVVVEMYSLKGMVARVTANFGPFCSKDLSSGVSSFLKRLITHLSWILEEVEEVNAVLKMLVVLKGILELVVEDLEMRCLSFLIWVFLYCRNVFSLLLKMIFCRFVKVGLSSFCFGDVLVLAISVMRCLILIFVHLFLLWLSEHSAFFIVACSKLLPFHFICKVFGVTLFDKHLRLKVLAVLNLASCISNFYNFFCFQQSFMVIRVFDKCKRIHLLYLVFQHKRQLTLHTFLISIYNRSVISMFTHLSNFKTTEPLDVHLQRNT